MSALAVAYRAVRVRAPPIGSGPGDPELGSPPPHSFFFFFLPPPHSHKTQSRKHEPLFSACTRAHTPIDLHVTGSVKEEKRLKNKASERKSAAKIKAPEKSRRSGATVTGRLSRGGGVAGWGCRHRRIGEKAPLPPKKTRLSRRGFHKNAAVLKSLGCSKCRTRKGGKSNSTDVPFSPDAHGATGWTRSSFSGLRSRGAAAASPSDHHTPSHLFPPRITSVP